MPEQSDTDSLIIDSFQSRRVAPVWLSPRFTFWSIEAAVGGEIGVFGFSVIDFSLRVDVDCGCSNLTSYKRVLTSWP